MEERCCAHCGGPIPDSKRPHAIYCSNICGNRARGLRYRKAHPEQLKRARLKHNCDVVRRMYSRVKCRAKREGIPFDIDVGDIVIPEKCPVLGIPIRGNPGKGSGFHPDSPSLDKIVPRLGYVKGNVRVISARANLLKSDATAEELLLVYKDVERIESEQAPIRL